MPARKEHRGQALELGPEIRLGSVECHLEGDRCRDPKLGRPAVCRDLAVPAEAAPGRGIAPHQEPIELDHGTHSSEDAG
jgi:hypothetical protein